MRRFVHEPAPTRIVMGPGSLAMVPAEIARLGCARVLLVHTPSQGAAADRLAGLPDTRVVGRSDQVAMHVPVERAKAMVALATQLQADGCIALGGGSAIGFGKALALELGLPILAIPTTYAGSEVTDILGMTAQGAKVTRREPRLRPRTVIYDPELTLSLPAKLSATSGLNALAHAVEGLYAADVDPIAALEADAALRALATSLPQVVAAPQDLAARSEALYGAWLAGSVLGAVPMALHHKLCHVLGGSFGLPHAEVHSVILPHATAYNAPAAPAAMARIVAALGAPAAAAGLFDLAVSLGAPTRLAELGMAEHDLGRAAELATQNAYGNPAPVTPAGLRSLLDDAFHGRRPTA